MHAILSPSIPPFPFRLLRCSCSSAVSCHVHESSEAAAIRHHTATEGETSLCYQKPQRIRAVVMWIKSTESVSNQRNQQQINWINIKSTESESNELNQHQINWITFQYLSVNERELQYCNTTIECPACDIQRPLYHVYTFVIILYLPHTSIPSSSLILQHTQPDFKFCTNWAYEFTNRSENHFRRCEKEIGVNLFICCVIRLTWIKNIFFVLRNI